MGRGLSGSESYLAVFVNLEEELVVVLEEVATLVGVVVVKVESWALGNLTENSTESMSS